MSEQSSSEPCEGTEAPDYEWLLENDAHLRVYIVKHYAAGAAEIDGRILCENMEHLFNWVKTGKVPESARNTRRAKLVASTDAK